MSGGRSDLALTACQMLAAAGVRAAVVSAPPGLRLLKLSRSCSSAEVAGPEDFERVLAAARSADLVFPADVPGTILAGRLKASLPAARFFPFPEEKTLRLLDDKWSFHRFLTERGIPAPRTWLLEGPEKAAELPLPVILKPTNREGGHGVELARDRAALERRLSSASPAVPVLAQEYLAGGDVDLSLLADRGRLVSWCVQTLDSGRAMDFIEDERVVELGRRVVAAAGYTGLAHIDMRYTDAARSDVRLIEFNPRLWRSAPRSLGLGTDFIGRGLALAYGEAPAPFAGKALGRCAALSEVFRRGPRTDSEKSLWELAKSDPIPFLVRHFQAAVLGGTAWT